jgi:endonuclease YncB( thermonuclease family)
MFQFVRLSAVVGILFFALVSFWPAVKNDHAGPAHVIDAATITVGGETHRFYGVLPLDHVCQRHDGASWPCDHEAMVALAKFLDGRTVKCEVWQGKARDADGRFISVCYAGSDDIAVWLVRNGWGKADRDANRLYNYTSDEGSARFLGKGMWGGGGQGGGRRQ